MGMTTYRELLDTATEDLTAKLGIKPHLATLIGLRDLIRTIYAAASNANAIAEDSDFARAIFLQACDQGMLWVIKSCITMIALDDAARLKDMTENPFVEVIGDLFND